MTVSGDVEDSSHIVVVKTTRLKSDPDSTPMSKTSISPNRRELYDMQDSDNRGRLIG